MCDSKFVYRQPTSCNNNALLIIPISSTCFGRWFRQSSGALDCVYSLWYNAPTSCNTQSSAPEDGRNHHQKHVELIEIINKPLLLHLVSCVYYWSSCSASVTLIRFKLKLNVLDRFSKNTHISNFMKICLVGPKFYMWTDRRTDRCTDRRKDYRHDEAKRRFSQFCVRT
jgi:hypothetical protein